MNWYESMLFVQKQLSTQTGLECVLKLKHLDGIPVQNLLQSKSMLCSIIIWQKQLRNAIQTFKFIFRNTYSLTKDVIVIFTAASISKNFGSVDFRAWVAFLKTICHEQIVLCRSERPIISKMQWNKSELWAAKSLTQVPWSSNMPQSTKPWFACFNQSSGKWLIKMVYNIYVLKFLLFTWASQPRKCFAVKQWQISCDYFVFCYLNCNIHVETRITKTNRPKKTTFGKKHFYFF